MLSEGLLTMVVRRQSWTSRLTRSMLIEGRLEMLRLPLLLPGGGDLWCIKEVRVKVFLKIVIARLVGCSCIVLDATEEARV